MVRRVFNASVRSVLTRCCCTETCFQRRSPSNTAREEEAIITAHLWLHGTCTACTCSTLSSRASPVASLLPPAPRVRRRLQMREEADANVCRVRLLRVYISWRGTRWREDFTPRINTLCHVIVSFYRRVNSLSVARWCFKQRGTEHCWSGQSAASGSGSCVEHGPFSLDALLWPVCGWPSKNTDTRFVSSEPRFRFIAGLCWSWVQRVLAQTSWIRMTPMTSFRMKLSDID